MRCLARVGHCVVPTDDALIIRFMRFVQPTRFPDISTTRFHSHGYRHQILRLVKLIESPRRPLWRSPYVYHGAPRTKQNPLCRQNKSLGAAGRSPRPCSSNLFPARCIVRIAGFGSEVNDIYVRTQLSSPPLLVLHVT